MKKRHLRNIYLCIIIPSLVAGLVAIGFYNLSIQLTQGLYPTSLLLLLTGAISYLIGSLIRGIFKWEEKKEDEK